MEVFTHHQHSLSQDSASASEALMMIQPPPPTLSRLPPDGHEFPPDYRDPTSNTFQVSITAVVKDIGDLTISATKWGQFLIILDVNASKPQSK